MREILTAVNIDKTFEDKKVLENINVCLGEGELVSILGVSGVGKTTLFNILSGLTKPDMGSVSLYGDISYNPDNFSPKDIKENDDAYEMSTESEKTDITGQTGYLSYMLQKDMLLPHKTVIDNVALPLILGGVSKKEARTRAREHFARFGLEGTEKKYPNQLSGGMRQRAAFLRTYLCGKKVMLLDEPFSALDALTRKSIYEWYLEVMGNAGLSTLLITHDVDEAILLSDRIYIMKGCPASIGGEIVIKTDKQRNHAFTLTEQFLEYKREIEALLI
ncbi:MAG: ABC transporter ATP-binding protein [Lachnospiraceae bacterium]|jgi:ABC-type nitrate/sulfonate/bicarbonate transport system ATPase subunit|nr:ABC transporter ATP-binding protein [Lachnospiraceae bacterium]